MPLGFVSRKFLINKWYVVCSLFFFFLSFTLICMCESFGLNVLSWSFFGSVIYVTIHLKQATVESIMRDKMPRKGGRWWFSWRGRNTTIKEVSLETNTQKERFSLVQQVLVFVVEFVFMLIRQSNKHKPEHRVFIRQLCHKVGEASEKVGKAEEKEGCAEGWAHPWLSYLAWRLWLNHSLSGTFLLL